MAHPVRPDVEPTLELLQRVRDGDSEAWQSIHERYRDALTNLAHGKLHGGVRRRLDTEDLLQSTFLAACEGLNGFVYKGRGSLDAWLKQILVHRINQSLRRHFSDKRDVRRHATASVFASQVDFSAMSPGDAILAAEDQLRFIEAIDGLPEPERRILAARVIDRVPTNDLAAALGVDASTIRRRHASAVAMVAKKLQ